MNSSLKDLNLTWHVPKEEEKSFATDLLTNFLLPELTRVENHIAGTNMSRCVCYNVTSQFLHLK